MARAASCLSRANCHGRAWARNLSEYQCQAGALFTGGRRESTAALVSIGKPNPPQLAYQTFFTKICANCSNFEPKQRLEAWTITRRRRAHSWLRNSAPSIHLARPPIPITPVIFLTPAVRVKSGCRAKPRRHGQDVVRMWLIMNELWHEIKFRKISPPGVVRQSIPSCEAGKPLLKAVGRD
jgi:hypothetical protein